jgi:hypothetical protein
MSDESGGPYCPKPKLALSSKLRRFMDRSRINDRLGLT